MHFANKEEAQKYVDTLREKEVLVIDVTIHAYWRLEFRTYAYKDKEAKERHIKEMLSKGWIDNESKQQECIFGSLRFDEEKIWVKVNQFKRFSEINQDQYVNG